jgi:hypothetical protein
VLLFALYGWAFAATVLIVVLYVRNRPEKKTSVPRHLLFDKENAPWRGKA